MHRLNKFNHEIRFADSGELNRENCFADSGKLNRESCFADSGRVYYKRRAVSLLLAVLLGITPVMNVWAEEEELSVEEEVTSVEDANETIDSYNDEETEWEEIHIRDLEDLRAFSRNCWLDTWSQNKKVYLEEDISISGGAFASVPTFGGYFDGQGHTISGLTIRDSVSYVGLFCQTQPMAVIANLKVEGTVTCLS